MIEGLRESFGGEVLGPSDAGYDEHRKVWNGSIDRRPGLIARCRGVADVRSAVRFGREHDLLVAVRSGGHSFPGLSVCDDGWVAECPDDLMTIVVQRLLPDLPAVPPELVGRLVVGVAVCWSGDLEAGERFVRPLQEHGPPLLDLCQRKPFLVHQRSFDASFRPGWWWPGSGRTRPPSTGATPDTRSTSTGTASTATASTPSASGLGTTGPPCPPTTPAST